MKKAQFKIQQMVFVLLAIVIFFVLVGLFWIVLQQRNLYKTVNEQKENQAMLLSQFLTGSTEFACPESGYCVDADKLIVLSEKQEYQGFWPVSYIKVRKINGQKNKICTKENYPDCNVFNVFGDEEGTGIGSFIALCRYEKKENYVQRKCELGKIIIGYESKW